MHDIMGDRDQEETRPPTRSLINRQCQEDIKLGSSSKGVTNTHEYQREYPRQSTYADSIESTVGILDNRYPKDLYCLRPRQTSASQNSI